MQMVGGSDLPTRLNEDLQDLVPKEKWEAAYEIVHGIIGDVLDSVRLAMSDAGLTEHRDRVLTEVEDYIANNYGED